MKRSKSYISKREKVTQNPLSKEDALKLVKSLPKAKFTESIEVHINLDIKEKTPVRATINFKHSFSKPKKIIAFVPADMEEQAISYGADYAGLDDYIKKIQDGWLDFDVVLAVPSVMPKIAVLGKTLGTKGLMPNPKNATVTNDLKTTIQGFKAGRVNIKADEYGIIHSVVGNMNNTEEEVRENMDSLIKGVLDALNRTDTSVIKTVHIASSMGPSIKIDTSKI